MTQGLASHALDDTLLDPAVVAAYLQHLIETQPVCLMRVDLEGNLLAANDAALRLLGADTHGQVLGCPLAERLTGQYEEAWRAFLTRTWNDDSGSMECEMVDLRGGRRTALLQAVAQRSTMDGTRSLVVTVQDISVRRCLEATLEKQRAGAALVDELQSELRQSEDKLEEMMKTVATYRVELLQIMQNVRDLEPMAAAGRVATGVARDVQTIVAEIDARTKDLLTRGEQAADDRRDIEMLRGSFIRISSLMRQLLQATGAAGQ